MKAGRNTPQSVLHYIDVIWARNAPPDPIELARELGYGPKRYRVLKEKHGERILIHLRRVKRMRTERPRFVAKQNGLLHPPQYVSSVEGAIDDAEAVPAEYDNEFSMKARERLEKQRREEDAEREAEKDLRAVQLEVRELVKRAVKMGIQPSTVIAPIAREIQAQHRELKDAA